MIDFGCGLDLLRNKLKPVGKPIVSGPTENFANKLGRILIGWSSKGDYHVLNIDDVNSSIMLHGFVLFA